MYYSTVVMLAILILLIENQDILRQKGSNTKQPVWQMYRRFLFAILVYYISDILWGMIEYLKLPTLLYIDTMFYFVAMASGILFWTRFTVTYLNEKSRYSDFLIHTGRVFFVMFAAAIVTNIFKPILFSVDEQCVYRANPIRHVFLIIQIILLILNSLYAIFCLVGKKDINRRRFQTIASFGLIMAIFLTIQLWFPYLPLYTVAYMLGTCLLHTFVINDEKEEYKAELEKVVEREKQQYKELVNTRVLAYRDPLTGVKSKLAYIEYESKIDKKIKEGLNPEFAVAVFDVNNLKEINDTFGHEKGDQYIKDACMTICCHFKHSPVFRIGGDEFAVLLEREDYRSRKELTESFLRMMEEAESTNKAVIAMGITDYKDGEDSNFHDVFVRADRIMYERKRELKSVR